MSASVTNVNSKMGAAEFHTMAERAWAVANDNLCLAPSPVVEAHKLEVRCLTPWEPGNGGYCRTPVDFVPVVTVDKMPPRRYPEYVSSLIGPTIACMRLESPQLWLASNTMDLVRLVTVCVAARAGFWAAVNWTPAASASLPEKALVYDTKRRNLWLAKSRGDKAHDVWLAVYSLPFVHMDHESEVVSQISVVSPALALTGAVTLTQLGPAYMVALMIKQVARAARSRMSEPAYQELNLADKYMVDAIRFGPMTGAPYAAARRWASDPLAAVCAQRRVADSPQEVVELQATEEDLLSGMSTPASSAMFDDDDQAFFEDPLMKRVREASSQAVAHETPIAPTVLNSGIDTPRPGTPTAARQEVEHASTPRQAMRAVDVEMIREVAANARQWAPPAPSELMGANAEEEVKW